jgi:hypothetical protein
VHRILTRALGLSESVTEDELAAAIADRMNPQTAPHMATEPASAPLGFLDGVARLTELGVPYGEAASIVSREAPDLYAKHVKDSQLN